MTEIAQQPVVDTPAPQTEDVLARLYGEPLFAIPQDLYIPPDALEVFLDAFEGPPQKENLMRKPACLVTDLELNSAP